MTITVSLNAPQWDAEERRIRAQRAAELLDGASWVIDELVSEDMREAMATRPHERDKREELHAEVRAALNLKSRLIGIVQHYQAEQTINEQRDRDRKPADHD